MPDLIDKDELLKYLQSNVEDAQNDQYRHNANQSFFEGIELTYTSIINHINTMPVEKRDE